MDKIQLTAFEMAMRFVDLKEIPGQVSNPQILAMLRLDATWPQDDKVPWCAGFVNYICWLLQLPRTKDLMARHWLKVGAVIDYTHVYPEVGFDIVILKRGGAGQPGIEELNAPGHVGFFAGFQGKDRVVLLGGNQDDKVCLKGFPVSRVLGYRRLKL